MERSVNDKIDGWDISLNRNVHMYTHALSVQNKQTKYSISCEDLPTNEKTIGIWLYTSSIPQARIKELQQVLLNWAKQYPIKFQIYASKDDFVTNK
jgi:hypothetical protein